MQPISVVIITKNEARNIVACILSARKVSDDIIVVDSGSSDATVLLAEREGVRVVPVTWKGYGHARNTGALLAGNEWILSLDADERVTDGLAASIRDIHAAEPVNIYGFRRTNYFGKKHIKHGALAHDRVFRIYHKTNARWNLVPVHEQLTGVSLRRVTLPAHLDHFGIRTQQHYYQKKMGYASLCALKYLQEKKRFIQVLRFLSPAFNFMKAYIFQLGFLDKRIGFIVARINAQYTRKKYQQLHSMMGQQEKPFTEYRLIANSVRKIISFLS